MHKRIFPTTWMLFCIFMCGLSYAAEMITISYSSRTYAFLPAQVAVVKGFFKDEALEPVLVQMRSQVAVPALMNGDIQYTLTFGNILTAAIQGMRSEESSVGKE